MVNTLKIIFFTTLFSSAMAAEPPAIMQTKKYVTGVSVSEYFVSEKLDGVRARWDGKQLISRHGNIFAVPVWFVSGFPDQVLEGELWLGRGEYQQTVSVVSRQQPHHGWRELKFMVFDLPNSTSPFSERYNEMNRLAVQSESPFLEVVKQRRVANHAQLMAQLNHVVDSGGEGLMLHHKDAMYVDGRSAHLLKLKKFDDAEAVVVGYKSGKGKYTGMTGSLKLRMDNGQMFYVGSGLTDDLRASPPPLGSMITFRHQGFTDKGLPRFPVYLRQRLMK